MEKTPDNELAAPSLAVKAYALGVRSYVAHCIHNESDIFANSFVQDLDPSVFVLAGLNLSNPNRETDNEILPEREEPTNTIYKPNRFRKIRHALAVGSAAFVSTVSMTLGTVESAVAANSVPKGPKVVHVNKLSSKGASPANSGATSSGTNVVNFKADLSAADTIPNAQLGFQTFRSSAANILQNPIRYGNDLLSCPDPSLINYLDKVIASCTSDYGQMNPIKGQKGYAPSAAAFPIYEAPLNNLNDFTFKNFVFPPGHHPDLAMAPTGGYPGGQYWADELHYYDHRWVDYFGAKIDPQKFKEKYHKTIQPGTFGIFVAYTKHLFGGNWESHLLHYSGQFNNVPGSSQEISGGVIDPTAIRQQNGNIEMAYAKQSNLIYTAMLTPDGLHMLNQVHLAVVANKSWECSPNAKGAGCVVEGPVLFQDPVHSNVVDLFYNADSTWNGSYKTGVAVSIDPNHQKWIDNPNPIQIGRNGLRGPGIGGQPIKDSKGNYLLPEHVQEVSSHASQRRWLAFVGIHFDTGANLMVSSAKSTDSVEAQTANQQGPNVPVSIPRIDDLRKYISVK